MRCSRLRIARSVAPALLALAVFCVVAAQDDTPPMTDEEVVRMFAAGRAAGEIIGEIERRRPDFDLSPEMLEELRNVRLPEAVLRAMIARQTEQRREMLAARELEETASRPRLLIRLNPDGQTTTVSLVRSVDPQFAAEWELGNAPEDRELADLALFVACLKGDHVPDQWRSKSPLGRDFFSPMPRHELLVFLSSAPGEGAEDPGGRRVTLDLPPTIEVPLVADESHDLMIGLALQVGGHYRRLRSDLWREVVLGEEGLVLPAVVKGRSFRRIRARFDRDEDDESGEDEDEDGPPDDRGP